jgi:thioredoxin 1
MMEHVKQVGDATFQREVLESTEPVLVDFTAAWCAPCKTLAPVVEAVAADHQGRLKVVKVDVDQAQATAEAFGIRAMPTLLFFRDGLVKKHLVGAVPRRTLEAAVREVLGEAVA